MNYRNLITSVLLTSGLFAQAIVGVVTDVNSNPLVGANVVVEGTEKGGVTDVTGKYTIDIGAQGDYDVTASFIGYSPVTNPVTVNDIVGTVNFLLKVDAVAMTASGQVGQNSSCASAGKRPKFHVCDITTDDIHDVDAHPFPNSLATSTCVPQSISYPPYLFGVKIL